MGSIESQNMPFPKFLLLQLSTTCFISCSRQACSKPPSWSSPYCSPACIHWVSQDSTSVSFLLIFSFVLRKFSSAATEERKYRSNLSQTWSTCIWTAVSNENLYFCFLNKSQHVIFVEPERQMILIIQQYHQMSRLFLAFALWCFILMLTAHSFPFWG